MFTNDKFSSPIELIPIIPCSLITEENISVLSRLLVFS